LPIHQKRCIRLSRKLKERAPRVIPENQLPAGWRVFLFREISNGKGDMYIYALCCPIGGDVRYIGKSRNPQGRFAQHIRTARSGHLHVSRWIRKLVRSGLYPRLDILHKVQPDEDWRLLERSYIARGLAQGLRLTNILAGGEGASYLDPAALESRNAALKRAWQNPDAKARLAAAMVKVFGRPEVIKKMSIAAKRNWGIPEYRAKLWGAATREKQSLRVSRYWKENRDLMHCRMNDPERVAKISSAMSLRNADPAFRAIVDAPDVRARQAATLKATWQRKREAMERDPAALAAFKAARSAAAKKAYQTRRATQ
jgi:hypothetical protein